MTTHYLQIQVQPDPEFATNHLMGALFSKLHRRLVALDTSAIGVSFPRHQLKPRDIGDTLRLHGHSQALEQLMAANWLRGVRELTHMQAIAPAPKDAGYRIVRRRQFKTNADRLRRRRMRRHNESEATAFEHIPDSVEQKVSLPFVQISSASTGQRFSLFIEHGPTSPQSSEGSFNSYGLSSEASVPWF